MTAPRTTHHSTSVTVVCISIAVGTLLFLAAIAKTISPNDTENALAWVFDDSRAHLLTLTLIFLEIILASLLLTGVAPHISLGLATILSASFLGWILYLHWTNAPVDCGCGVRLPFLTSGGSESHRGVALIRTGILFTVSGIGWWLAFFRRGDVPRLSFRSKKGVFR